LWWVYLHLPIAMGITAVGAGILNVVEHAGEALPSAVRWLLVVAIAVVLASIGFLLKTLNLPESQRQVYRTGAHVTFGASLFVLAAGLLPLSAAALLVVLIALLLVPVLYGILVWIKVFDARELGH
jgi:low temperature requirement protein LtrA